MKKTIRIGTRDSELALWQAKTVQHQLEYLGYETELVPVKATGDLVLNKPIYELGITGVFTRNLDVALLNKEIDIAVHSLKDVPTILPKGIVQVAVLKRGTPYDVMVFKNNEEFLSQRDAVIATGSLRRKAQWLHQYPTHTVVDLRGNVNTRLQKLEDNEDWNGAIFAAAGLERIGIKPKTTFSLSWMIPAPAQGAVMVAALDEDEFVKEACAELNHKETEICTSIEREFLNRLEGGCTAPIGALAYITKDDEIQFNGVLFSQDGTKKIATSKKVPLGRHRYLAKDCAEHIISKGGRQIIADDTAAQIEKNISIYSTKSLSESQTKQFHDTIAVTHSDFIKIRSNRISPTVVKNEIENVIITSKNAVESLLTNFTAEELQFKNIYCVGGKTKRFIGKKIGKVKHSEQSAEKLAAYLIDEIKEGKVTYFCSNLRLDNLPTMLTENGIEVNEIEAYKTMYSPVKVDEKIDGVLFYSPSGVKSYLGENKGGKIAFCIGETTATEAKKHFDNVQVSKIPSVESLIELVNSQFIKSE